MVCVTPTSRDIEQLGLILIATALINYRELICFSKNLILEQIEIFQFCLKIRHIHPWVGAWVVGWMGGLIGGVR